MATDDEEARAHPRARARIKVEYHFGGTTGVGHSNDISEGGIFVYCDRVARTSTRVYLRLHLPGSRAGDPLKIIGTVRRTVDPLGTAGASASPSGMGIEFEVAYARTRQQLADFVETLLTAGQQDPPPAIQEIGGAAFGARLGGDGALMDAAGVERAFSFAAPAEAKSGRLFQLVLLMVVVGLGLYVVVNLVGR